MSAEIQMSSPTDGGVDFPYRALSRGAVISAILVVFALPGLIQDFAPLLAISILGLVAGLIGLRATRRYPEEFSGGKLAAAGVLIHAALLVVGVSLHTYTYLTEVPEGYTRVGFHELQQDEGKTNQPTEKAVQINGEDIFLKGYIHPSSGSGLLRHFILVPDLGTCCFGGQPESSDMIEVTLTGGQSAKANLRKKKLAGKFSVSASGHGVSGFDKSIFYRIRADQVK